MFNLIHEIKIKITNIPIQWIPKIELFYPDLPQFPIIYIHSYINESRLIACPIYVNYEINDVSCDAEFTLLSNVEENSHLLSVIQTELEHRIGYSNQITEGDILACCNGNAEYEVLFKELWKYIESSFGHSLPFGKYYEEVFSIVRFVAAWQPKTGRQSEMRMLYNFMSLFGEPCCLPDKWSHLEFYVIPNLNDINTNNFNDFPIFSVLVTTMSKLFDEYFTKQVTLNNKDFLVMDSAWKQNKEEFISRVSKPMYQSGVFNESEKIFSEKLVDAFNRHSWRAAYFISSYMNLDKDYANWDKQFFIDFYGLGKFKGYAPKVMACFMQQGFMNMEAIPIDTWIKTFYEYVLGIQSKEEFFTNFSSVAKLERLIWLASQSNKTNMKNFFNILWCQRYGTRGNEILRGVNPIACYSCNLKNVCIGLKHQKNDSVSLIFDETETTNSTIFSCLLSTNVPIKCYKHEILVDEFSGYNLNLNDALPLELINKKVVTVEEIVFHKQRQ